MDDAITIATTLKAPLSVHRAPGKGRLWSPDHHAPRRHRRD